MTSFYSIEELIEIGFKSFGDNVLISRKASFYSIHNITIGSNVRIDDFCILSGNISIGNYVHINPYTGIYASTAGVIIDDYANFASRITIYAISDDYSGETLTSPLIPEKYKNLHKELVYIGKYVIIGTGTSILPGVHIKEGCAIGAMSLVKKSTNEWGVYAGHPLRFIKKRSKNMLNLLQDSYE